MLENVQDFVAKFPARVAVVAKSLLTYLVVAQTILTVVVTNGEVLNLGKGLEWVVVCLSAIGTAITFIRRVAPVEPDQRGILAE